MIIMRVSAGVDAQVNVILNNRHVAKYVVLDAEIDEKKMLVLLL